VGGVFEKIRNRFMNYKSYEAVVVYEDDDKLFVVKVINSRDVIDFDGFSVDELEASFFAAVDEYLQDCDRLGKDPDKPFDMLSRSLSTSSPEPQNS
jgi:predicted HicB family RNase H-like nuclease